MALECNTSERQDECGSTLRLSFGLLAEKFANYLNRRFLVLGLDVRLRGEARSGDASGLDGGDEVEGPEARSAAETNLPLLCLLRGVIAFPVDDRDLYGEPVEAGHQGGHVDDATPRVHPEDPIAEVHPLTHNLLVGGTDALVLRDPAEDRLVGFPVLSQVASQVHPPGVITNAGLHRSVHHPAEAGGEVHPVAGVRGSVHHLERGEPVAERPMVKSLAAHLVRLVAQEEAA